MSTTIFPLWVNSLRGLIPVAAGVAPIYLGGLAFFGLSPLTLDVGYQPKQPVPFSHALHAGKLGMDCRYCHTTVEKAAFAAIPPTQTCMNCHTLVKTTSEKLTPVRDSFTTGDPVQWKKVHDLADFVYFNHSAHVTRGVGCKSCHGRIDQMEVVFQHEPLSMAWCLECHRAPEKHLRPVDKVTKMDYELEPREQLSQGEQIRKDLNLNPSQSCSTCHR